MTPPRAVWALALCVGCAPVRFHDRPTVWHERDDQPVPMPRAFPHSVHASAIREIVFLPPDRALALDFGVEAQNVNALDEIGDSSWFEDPRRAGVVGRRRERSCSVTSPKTT